MRANSGSQGQPASLLPRGSKAHVRVKARHDLDDREALRDAVRDQLLEVARPRQALAQAEPPSVTEPEEGCAIGVLQITLVL